MSYDYSENILVQVHLPSCTSVTQMKVANRQEFTGTRDEVIADGYEPCKNCNP